MYCDAHIHSTHYPPADLQQKGLYLSCAASMKDWQNLLDDRRVIPFLGIHPEKITPAWGEDLKILDELLRKNPRAGLGECGLDRRFYPDHSRELQERVLKAHFDLALKYRRPVVLHQVGASGALADFLSHQKPDIPVMIHGFHGSREVLQRYIKGGLFISVGPGRHWADPDFLSLVSSIPSEKLLIETDWPYGRLAEDVPHSLALQEFYSQVSSGLGIDKKELAGIVRRNGEIFTH